MENSKPPSKKMFWAGWIISILSILFSLMDAGMKVVKATPAMQGSAELGWPADLVQVPGFILLVFTILYVLPRTAVAGAPGHPYFFPIVFGVAVWAGVYLRSAKLRAFVAG